MLHILHEVLGRVSVIADLQAYNSLIKNYTTVTERLGKLLPPEKRESRLEQLARE